MLRTEHDYYSRSVCIASCTRFDDVLAFNTSIKYSYVLIMPVCYTHVVTGVKITPSS